MTDYYTSYPRTILWLVPGGSVAIGGSTAEAQPAFEAEVEPFYISKWPITNEQFEAFDPGYERSDVSPGDRDPAVDVDWEDAREYCEWYAEVSRKPMRLPTEIEWEYACRGGSMSRWPSGDDFDEAGDFQWDADNSESRVQPIDKKRGNGFGLHGMLGSVWEWTGSLYRPYPLTPEDSEEVQGADQPRRVLRGGSFRTSRAELTASLRRAEPPEVRSDDIGFRVVKPLR